MSYNYLELTELEEDYTGQDKANLVTAELHEFEDPAERFFSPDLGQFYVNDAFSVNDMTTGNPLVRDKDYTISYFSKRVFKKSGLDNGYLIHVLNTSVKGVNVTYQGVGGLYTSPAYLIKVMMEKYPDGIGPVIYWKNVLFKPDQFVPAGHKHHALEIYGLSPLNDGLERVRGAMADSDRVKFDAFYDNTLSRFEELLNTINNGYNGLLDNFQQTRKGLELQQGDFIYTDSMADQATLRRYGKWRRHINAMLAAGGPNNAGTSMSVGSGYSNPIRQTNLYQRIDDPWGEAGEIVEKTLLLQPSKTSFNEGETITIDVVGVNIEPGTMVTGNFIGLAADNIKGGKLNWQVTLDAFGKGVIKLETISNHRTTGNVEITILPEQFATSAITVTMIDVSNTPVYTLNFSADAQGLNLITKANEGSVIYMNLVVKNPIPNEEVAVNYTAGTVSQADFITVLPDKLIIPSNGIIRVRLELKNDEKAEGREVFVASILPKGAIDLNLTKARAEIIIEDSSYQAEFNAIFSLDTDGKNPITEINEGQAFYLYAKTSLPNGTVVNFDFGGNMELDDYSERPTTAIVSGGIVVAAIATRADARTDGDKILGLTIKRTNGIALANLSLVVRDTSLAPEATIYFTDTNGGLKPVDTFNEGQTIFITINTRNVESGTYIDLSYMMDGAINQSEINKEFTAPLPTRVPVSNNKVIVAATILEDYKADQNRNFRCTLDMSGVYASCIIRDTSVPIINAKFTDNSAGSGSITEANEGQTVYLTIDSKGYAAGTDLSLTYTGGATDADFEAPRPTTFKVASSGKNIIAMKVKNDFTSEGVETMKVAVKSGISTVASADLTIRDTSLTPTLNIFLASTAASLVPLTSINEGVTAYVHVEYNNLPLNSTIDWYVSNITTVAADFDKSSGKMTNESYNGHKQDTLTTRLDKTSEGDETFVINAKVNLGGGRELVSETAIITLSDTSKTENFNLVFSSDAEGNNPVSRINEGSSVYLVGRGINIPAGTNFKLSLPSNGAGFVNDADITPSVTNKVVVMNNDKFSELFKIEADRLTEGDETLIIRATRTDTNIPKDATIVVTDTSVTVDTTASLFLANGTKPANNAFKEGESGYLLLSYSNAAVGDRIKPDLPGGVGNVTLADFSSSEFGTERAITNASGSLRWNFTIKADRVTEGDENFNVKVNNLTAATLYPLDGSYKILDTTKTTSYLNSGWYNKADVGITVANEGTTAILQTQPVDGQIGDVYRMQITGGTAVLNTDYTVNTDNLVYNLVGMKMQWPFDLKADRITDGNRTIIASITNVTSGQLVGTFNLGITDTSKTPSAVASFIDAPVSFGGTTITSVNEGNSAWLKLVLVNQEPGDKWRISIDPSSGAKAADIDNFVTTVLDVPATLNSYLEKEIRTTADSLTEGPETLVFKLELQQKGTTTWADAGKASILINDTSKTPTFDTYYSTKADGSDRITSSDEGKTIYLICKTANVATGTVLQVGFAGSTVNSDDFTTAPPYAFPPNINTLVPMTVQSNGIAYYRFDIKADLSEG